MCCPWYSSFRNGHVSLKIRARSKTWFIVLLKVPVSVELRAQACMVGGRGGGGAGFSRGRGLWYNIRANLTSAKFRRLLKLFEI